MRDTVDSLVISRSRAPRGCRLFISGVIVAATSSVVADEIGPRGIEIGVQVNVDAAGRNIVGDAANEPSICVDRTRPNRIAVGWRQFNTVSSNFREAGYAYSRDAGRTWRFPGTLRPGQFNSDPVLRSDSSGRFYFLTLPDDIESLQLFLSDDGGATWTGGGELQGGDKAWFTIDSTGGMGDGNIYVYWSRFFGCCSSRVFSRSTDGGDTFEMPQTFGSAGEAVYGTLDVNRAGRLYAIGISSPNAQGVWRVNRSDTAADSSQPVRFLPARSVSLGGYLSFGTARINADGILGQSWIAVDRSGGDRDGWVYALCSIRINTGGADPMDVHLIRSTDGGDTWSAVTKVGDEPDGVNAWQWFGTLSIAPNGRLDVIWYDTRVDANPLLPDNSALFYSSSSDGAFTWTPPVQLSPAFGHRIGNPQQNKIGDYIDMYSDDVGAGIVYAATHNGEQDVWFYRVGDYDCNGNSIGDLLDIASGLEADFNNNGNPDSCECIGDIDRDLTIGLADLARLLTGYGICQESPEFDAALDLDANGCVGLDDLGALLARFGGDCP